MTTIIYESPPIIGPTNPSKHPRQGDFPHSPCNHNEYPMIFSKLQSTKWGKLWLSAWWSAVEKRNLHKLLDLLIKGRVESQIVSYRFDL
eukprot:scaffold450421_cov18-Prasinocladus_malaysianus.AAC.1